MTLFSQLKKQLKDLQNPRTLHDLHNLAGHAAHELVMEGFARETDPYGAHWAPTTRPNPILQDTLALRGGIRVKADSRAVVIRTTGKANKYAHFHQFGTRGRARGVDKRGRFRSDRSTNRLKRSAAIRFVPGLPARKFLPDEGRMPVGWAVRFQADFRRYFREKYGGS